MKSISSGTDTSRSSNDEGTEEGDAEEEGSLNSSGEKIESTAKASNIATEAGAASFSDKKYGNDLFSSESTRKRRKQVLNMPKNRKDHKLTSILSNESCYFS